MKEFTKILQKKALHDTMRTRGISRTMAVTLQKIKWICPLFLILIHFRQFLPRKSGKQYGRDGRQPGRGVCLPSGPEKGHGAEWVCGYHIKSVGKRDRMYGFSVVKIS